MGTVSFEQASGIIDALAEQIENRLSGPLALSTQKTSGWETPGSINGPEHALIVSNESGRLTVTIKLNSDAAFDVDKSCAIPTGFLGPSAGRPAPLGTVRGVDSEGVVDLISGFFSAEAPDVTKG